MATVTDARALELDRALELVEAAHAVFEFRKGEEDDPRYALLFAIVRSWSQQEEKRWHAAASMLWESVSPQPFEAEITELLVEVDHLFAGFIAGRHSDSAEGIREAVELRAAIDRLGRIAELYTADAISAF